MFANAITATVNIRGDRTHPGPAGETASPADTVARPDTSHHLRSPSAHFASPS
jgi:hypothetical protein